MRAVSSVTVGGCVVVVVVVVAVVVVVVVVIVFVFFVFVVVCEVVVVVVFLPDFVPDFSMIAAAKPLLGKRSGPCAEARRPWSRVRGRVLCLCKTSRDGPGGRRS